MTSKRLTELSTQARLDLLDNPMPVMKITALVGCTDPVVFRKAFSFDPQLELVWEVLVAEMPKEMLAELITEVKNAGLYRFLGREDLLQTEVYYILGEARKNDKLVYAATFAHRNHWWMLYIFWNNYRTADNYIVSSYVNYLFEFYWSMLAINLPENHLKHSLKLCTYVKVIRESSVDAKLRIAVWANSYIEKASRTAVGSEIADLKLVKLQLASLVQKDFR